MNQRIVKFLEQSNLIEKVGQEGLRDSIIAYEYLDKVKAPLQEKHLLEVHRLVMINLNKRIAGKYRKCLVQVGNRVCPPSCVIPEKIEKIIKWFNVKKPRLNKIEKANYCKLIHIAFESLHPFEDGNGRVGRILLNWQRKQMGLPLLIIKNNEKYDYYNWFL